MAKAFKKTVRQKIKASGKEFRVHKHDADDATSEIAIELDDVNDIEVELLEISDLPPTHNGKPVTWFNNFSVKKGGAYLTKAHKISYTIHFDELPAGSTFVYFDGEKILDDLKPERSERAGKQKVTFNIGDPGTGWVK